LLPCHPIEMARGISIKIAKRKTIIRSDHLLLVTSHQRLDTSWVTPNKAIYVVLQRSRSCPRLIHQHLVAALTVHHIVAASGGTP
jgi:hypothetical protein